MSDSLERGTPLSPAQQGALLPERLRRVPAANLFLGLEITGGLDGEAFGRAAVALVTEHEILRTVFPDDRRVPCQRVVPVPASVLEVIRIDDTALDSALCADAAHRFDPVQEIPVRIRRYELPDREVISIAVHPVAADDRALELLANELFAAVEHGRVAPASAQYRVFALEHLKRLAATAADDHALAYWIERLDRLPGRAVPVANRTAAPGARRTFRLGRDVLAAFLGGQDRVAAFAAVLTCALRDAGMGEDIPVGVVDPARTGLATGNALGNFANHLVLRLDSVPDVVPADLVAAAAERLAEARQHAQTRIERLTHQLRGAAAVTGGLFQVLVGVRTGAPIELSVAGCDVREFVRHTARPHGVDIALDVAVGADGAAVTMDFAAALSSGAVDQFAAHLENRCLAWAVGRDERAEIELFEPGVSGAGLLCGPGMGGPPQTGAECAVAASIRKILDLDEDDEVGRADTFFSLGGDSITALRLVTDLVEQGYALDVQTVFGYPVVHELATQLAEPRAVTTAETSATVGPMGASGLDPAALAALGEKFGARLG